MRENIVGASLAGALGASGGKEDPCSLHDKKRKEKCMKIGMVSPYDWSYPGGVRNHIWQLAEQFIIMGHDVRSIAPASRTQDDILDEYVYTLGSTVPFPIIYCLLLYVLVQ